MKDRTEYLTAITEGDLKLEGVERIVADSFRGSEKEMRKLVGAVQSYERELEKARNMLQATRGKASALAEVLWEAEEKRRAAQTMPATMPSLMPPAPPPLPSETASNGAKATPLQAAVLPLG